MNAFKIIDVTFRDGGHINDFHFSDNQIKEIITALDSAKLDFIEVGYRNGSISDIKNIGPAGLCPNDFLVKCKSYFSHSKMAVMAHCKNINESDIHELKDCGVDLLRLCIPKGSHTEAYALIKSAKQAGLMVSTNLIHISQYTDNEIFEVSKEIQKHNPDMIYFADSNGCLHTERVSKIFQTCTPKHELAFGFHSHDNIGLAQCNTIAAINHGAQYLDASLAGAGKGIGNLRLEFFIAYLHSINNKQYEWPIICKASNMIRQTLIKNQLITEGEFIRGILDLSTKQLGEYLNAHFKGTS